MIAFTKLLYRIAPSQKCWLVLNNLAIFERLTNCWLGQKDNCSAMSLGDPTFRSRITDMVSCHICVLLSGRVKQVSNFDGIRWLSLHPFDLITQVWCPDLWQFEHKNTNKQLDCLLRSCFSLLTYLFNWYLRNWSQRKLVLLFYNTCLVFSF